MPGAVVIGAVPGIGRSVARRFADEGLPIALIARGKETVEAAAEAVARSGTRVVCLTADNTNETALRVAFPCVRAGLRIPSALTRRPLVVHC
ncbi:SDR family NAD(P)-dependent oxidoreductase [Protofrankia symbiont of Coriaria ruscifolia]|uniref:SDR family NAD(P)-dependent oxidoreductase n=1 Tax=Protofrankia symbiont of Coriaria ruscifolia TaxID=1306542 RepID=UPI00104154CA